MELVPPTTEGIAQALEALKRGEVVAYPTETVYGLGVDPFNLDAIERLYSVKGRDPNNPMLLIVSGLEQLDSVAASVSPNARKCIDVFWPGPLSVLFPAVEMLPRELCGPGGTVCVRWTACEIASSLCDAFGGALVSTSANRSGESPAVTPSQVPDDDVSICIDGGELETNVPSTVFDPEQVRVLREGAIDAVELETVVRG